MHVLRSCNGGGGIRGDGRDDGVGGSGLGQHSAQSRHAVMSASVNG